MAQVQVNFRAPSEVLGRVERARGSGSRNAWLLAAVVEKLRRDGVVAPVRAVEVVMPSRPVSVRAPRGCRVVGVPRALRELPAPDAGVPVPIPGQIDLEEALAS